MTLWGTYAEGPANPKGVAGIARFVTSTIESSPQALFLCGLERRLGCWSIGEVVKRGLKGIRSLLLGCRRFCHSVLVEAKTVFIVQVRVLMQ